MVETISQDSIGEHLTQGKLLEFPLGAEFLLDSTDRQAIEAFALSVRIEFKFLENDRRYATEAHQYTPMYRVMQGDTHWALAARLVRQILRRIAYATAGFASRAGLAVDG